MNIHKKQIYILRIIFAALVIFIAVGASGLAASSGMTRTVAEKEKDITPVPDHNNDDWNLILVNPWNALPDDYSVTLKKLSNGYLVDERCYDDLIEMMADCSEAGFKPVICSAYRTWAKQEQLYNNKVNRLVAQGYSKSEAKTEAAKVVAVPGTSEHQLGLAVDIVDRNNQNLNSSQADTKTQKWLMENSWEYGFILRYPEDKTDITGITYEPWHYRYVGREAAEYIYSNDLCLEEYLKAH